MFLRHALLAVAVSSLSFAGVIIYPGQHPNYDAQILFFPILTQPFLSSTLLNTQFPQWNYVEAAPDMIGYLDPVNPARPIVWTTTISEKDETALARQIGGPVDTSYQQKLPQTPEPAPILSMGASLLALASWRFRVARAARPAGLEPLVH